MECGDWLADGESDLAKEGPVFMYVLGALSGLEGPLGAGDHELAEHPEYSELLTAWAQVQSTGVSDFTGSFPWAGQAQWEDERTRVWLAQDSEEDGLGGRTGEEAPQQGFLARSTRGAERDRRGF